MATDQTMEPTSTRPYLIRALHEWCCDNGFTPYIAVVVDASVQVPLEFVENGEIVLNVGFDATAALRIGNDFIEFKARFSGSARDIMVPIDHVTAIFSRESGQGMAPPGGCITCQGCGGGCPRQSADQSGASWSGSGAR